jgi:hypothetical protein
MLNMTDLSRALGLVDGPSRTLAATNMVYSRCVVVSQIPGASNRPPLLVSRCSPQHTLYAFSTSRESVLPNPIARRVRNRGARNLTPRPRLLLI